MTEPEEASRPEVLWPEMDYYALLGISRQVRRRVRIESQS